MIPMSAITINWTGTPLTPEQKVLIQDAALDFESHGTDERLVFEHPLCDGMIECKGRMTHGMYRGTRFVATLDGEDGKSRTYEFLLTDFYTREQRAKVKAFWMVIPSTGTRQEVDGDVIRKTKTLSSKRSRLN